MVADGPSIHARSRSPGPWVMQLRDDTGAVVATRCGWLVTPPPVRLPAGSCAPDLAEAGGDAIVSETRQHPTVSSAVLHEVTP